MANKYEIAVPALTGTRAVVTGGSDGIGLRLAGRLALAGTEVVLPVRNRDKGRAALERIRREAPGAAVSLRDLDLSSLDSVAALAATLNDEGVPIGVLINNAGVMTPPGRQETADGFELQFGINHLGHFALVSRLMPMLRAGRARVTSQTSIAANRYAINWDDLQWRKGYHGGRAYSQAKIAVGLFALELQRRSVAGGWGITSNLAHPGIAPTSLLAARPEMGRSRDTVLVRVIRVLSRAGILFGTPETAALPALYAATSPDARGGGFYGPSGPAHLGGPPGEQELYSHLREPGTPARKAGSARKGTAGGAGETAETGEAARLWEISEELTRTAAIWRATTPQG
jgi:NAD(P)-dependent dehydrogenase (short-subunit alcohol dehydrogenase family)